MRELSMQNAKKEPVTLGHAPSSAVVDLLAPRFGARFGLPAITGEDLLEDLFEGGASPLRPARWVARVKQVHGIRVLRVDEGTDAQWLRQQEADALVTTAAGIGLVVRTADCVPLLLADPDGNACAAVHAGWRGAVNGIVGETVAALEALGAPPSRLVAALGPCIGSCCFEVGEEVAAPFEARFGAFAVRRPPDAPRPFVDLPASVRHALVAAGLDPARITAEPPCTVCNDEPRFASYRRAFRAHVTLDAHQASLIIRR